MKKNALAKAQPQWTEILRTLMGQNGLNPRSLSLKAGLGPTAVRDMLEGRARFPRYDTTLALAGALGVTAAQLMGNEPLDGKGAASLTNGAIASDEDEADLGLLTEIIAGLQEAARDLREHLQPQDFAAMVATLYRSTAARESGKKPSPAKLSSDIAQLISYETLRRKPLRR